MRKADVLLFELPWLSLLLVLERADGKRDVTEGLRSHLPATIGLCSV